jgi:hypothetical protein
LDLNTKKYQFYMEDRREFTAEQKRAIQWSIKLGRDLQIDHPEISIMYSFYSQEKIVEMLDIRSK